MLANRKISGEYTWRDHVHKTTYTGSYEQSFLEFLDQIMNFDPDDVMAPSPHTYWYMYEGEKHFYMPDFFIPSLDLEIEIKDGGENVNMHPKIQAIDKVKEKLKDDVMLHNQFNYIKIVNKDNTAFFKFLEEAKEQQFDKVQKPIYIIEKEDSYIEGEVVTESDTGKSINGISSFQKLINESIDELIEERNDDIVNDGVTNHFVDKNDVRKIDIINKKFKNGKISKDEFEKQVKEIQKNNKGQFPAPKNGSKAFFDPNKESARPKGQTRGITDLSTIKKGGTNNIRIDGVVDETTFNNLYRHISICRTTENYAEYKQHHFQICKMCGVPSTATIGVGAKFDDNARKVVIPFFCETPKKANIPTGSVLYHTSSQKGIKRLTGRWKSSDGALYSSMRVYFSVGQAMSKTGVGGYNTTYVYTGPTNNAYIDPELHGSAVYIETNTSIPVKEMNEKGDNKS
jgi:hypothetical protein